MPPEILGPTGLVIGALAVVVELWRRHLEADRDDREQRDKALAVVEGLIPALRELTATVKADIEDRAKRQRKSDP